MTAVSATVDVTNTDYETLASVAGISLTSSATYSIQVQGTLGFKVGDAEFTFNDEKFAYTYGTETPYVKNGGSFTAKLVILENED